MTEMAEVTCDIVWITGQAVKINAGDEDVWIPKAQLDEDQLEELEVGQEAIELLVSERTAFSKGLI